MPAKIEIVEDEAALLKLINYNLVQAGYSTATAATGYEALDVFRREQPDLVLLDVMLPDIDGFDVCREIRRTSSVPIIFLTARGEEIDRVLGLELGADDYVTKPFSPRELVARVKAHLRRVNDLGDRASGLSAKTADTASSASAAGGATGGDDEVITIGELVVDGIAHEARYAGEVLPLTPTEFRLLAHLASHRGRALSRDQLLTGVWGEDYFGDERVVDVHVSHLRERLTAVSGQPSLIETVRGVGYRMRGERR